MSAISKSVPKLHFCIMSLKIILLKLLQHLPGTNELNEYRIWLKFHSKTCPCPQQIIFLSHGTVLFVQVLYNTLRPRQDGRHFPDDIFKCIFLNEDVWILITISLNFVSKGPINNIPTLVQIMAWCWPGGKPLSEPMMVSLLTHICVTRPQWDNIFCH